LDRDYNAALNLASLVSENGEGPNRPGLPVELGEVQTPTVKQEAG